MAEQQRKSMADFFQNDNKTDNTSFFSLRGFITIFYLYWYWIVLSVAACYVGARIYLRYYTTDTYSAGMKVLIKSENNKSSRSNSIGSLEEMGVISNTSGFYNEMEILRSTAISTRVVKTLKLYVSYQMEGRIKNRELYKNSPILVDIDEANLTNLNTDITLTIAQNGKGIKVEGDVAGYKHINQTLANLPATIPTAVGTLIFQQNPGYKMPSDKQLYVRITPLTNAGRSYANRLASTSSEKGASVAQILFYDTQVNRAVDYLAELINSYNEDANEDKNEVARKTEEFIRERIEVIREELDSTETGLEIYKKTNKLINLPNDASNALTNTTNYQQRQVEIQTQITLLQALIDYTNSPANMFEIIPANLGTGTSVPEIQEYNTLVMERKRLLKVSSDTNPTIMKLTAQIETLWPAIGFALKTLHSNMLVQKRSIDNQYEMFNQKVASTPTQERILNNITRQQDIKSGLYLMLLQKREQNFISLASTATKARVIDAPRFLGKVSPDDQKIKLSALAIGFVLPIAILYLLTLMRYRIEGREDVERLTKAPILADIPMAKVDTDSKGIVVNPNKNNMMEEAFRGLRTNLRFVLQDPEKVIICTSCIPGEGKTFIASNLSMSLSLLDKRVLLIGLDIRKPRLAQMFGLKDRSKGITSFLMLDHPDYEVLENQIYREVMNKNLDILPAGHIAPNPSELISRPLLDDAIRYLRDKYDYIVLDTAPVGLVSDTLELARTADATFFVCRADYSIKANFELINEIRNNEKMPKINLVLNGIDLKKRKYGYYYGYGKYGTYGKNGKYGYYGKYSHYGHYGVYGNYNNEEA